MSAAARLLGLRVRLLLRAWTSVSSVVCCQVSAMVRSLVKRNPTECLYVSFSVIGCKSDPLHLQGIGRQRSH